MLATTRTVWNTTQTMAPKSAVKDHKMRSEVTSYQDQLDIYALKPGQFRSASLTKREDKITGSDDDRLVFWNGGSIEDKPGEGGLLLTYPDGTQREMPGWIDVFSEEPMVNFKVEDRFGDWNTWSQTFPQDGGTRISVEEEEWQRQIDVSPSGQVAAKAEQWGDPLEVSGKVEGPALVLQSDSHTEAIVPAVPMDWILS